MTHATHNELDLARRIIHQLQAELRDMHDRADALEAQNRVLTQANASLARRLDAALGPAWAKREGGAGVSKPEDWDRVYTVEITGKTLEAMRFLSRWVLDEAGVLLPFSTIAACDHVFSWSNEVRSGGHTARQRPRPAGPRVEHCARCGDVLNNVAPGWSVLNTGETVCTNCLRGGETIVAVAK